VNNTPVYRANVPMRIERFMEVCGHFETESGVNNGYGCLHPGQETRARGEDGNEHGCCYAFSCPLATDLYPETDLADRRVLNRFYGLRANAANTFSDGEWVTPNADAPAEGERK
jgi:hypothetical protein